MITGDLTTTALPSEFREAARLLAPLLTNPARVTVMPGNHDRTTGRSLRSRRFEGTFGIYMPAPRFPGRCIHGDTAILGWTPPGLVSRRGDACPTTSLQRLRR